MRSAPTASAQAVAPKAAPVAESQPVGHGNWRDAEVMLTVAEEKRLRFVLKKEELERQIGLLAEMVILLDKAVAEKDDEIRGLRRMA